MVNASLNWASIVGIVLAVGGTMLYFLRSFKPGLARDYDVFFAAVGLLCGGILIFQGWRLDPILQFGQFLLAATTVFFAYESVRLRSVTTEQARRSAFFDEDEPLPSRPRMGRSEWGNEDRFEDPQPLRRKIRSRADDMDEPEEEIDRDFYRPRRPERPAIPERAQSRFAASTDAPPEFGARRRERDSRESKPRAQTSATTRGMPPSDDLPRSSRRPAPSASSSSPTRSSRPEAGAAISEADFSPLPPRPRPANANNLNNINNNNLNNNNPSNNSRFDS